MQTTKKTNAASDRKLDTSKTRRTTAEDAFNQGRHNYGILIERLGEKMLADARAFASSGKKSYAYAGSTEEVVRQLAIALATIGDRSGVDELGITF